MRHSSLITIICLLSAIRLAAQGKEPPLPTKYTIFITGASFASDHNGWFEIGCEQLNARPINRAVGGEAIANTANKMSDSTLYTREELEEMDAFVIMHVHDKDVIDSTQLKAAYTDYPTPFDRSNYAAAYDYVIKRYITECYNLKFDERSKYYGTKTGKPAVIILCTHWHDGRTTYNRTIRELSRKWGLPLVEFDKNIGFSGSQPHPVTGEPFSMLYAYDKQMMGGVLHGQHPDRGKDQYIQKRMAAIFADLMRRIF